MGIQIGDTLYRKGRKPEERSAGECFDVPEFRSEHAKEEASKQVGQREDVLKGGGIKPKPRW